MRFSCTTQSTSGGPMAERGRPCGTATDSVSAVRLPRGLRSAVAIFAGDAVGDSFTFDHLSPAEAIAKNRGRNIARAARNGRSMTTCVPAATKNAASRLIGNRPVHVVFS
jgi:hypothetical protein